MEKEGSFTIEFIDTILVELDGMAPRPEFKARDLRAFTEPMISRHFGEEVMDRLYDKVRDILVEDSKQGNILTRTGIAIVIELKKKNK